MIRYRTSLSNILAISSVFIVGIILLYLASDYSLGEFVRRAYGFFIVAFGLIAFPALLSYSEIHERTFKFVNFLFFRYKVEIDKITEVQYGPMFKPFKGFLNNFYIFYDDANGESKYIYLSELLFDKKVLAHMLRNLRTKNPNIKFDNHVRKLAGDG